MPVPSAGQKFRMINWLEIGENSPGMGTFVLPWKDFPVRNFYNL
jgi:hypothetical protein